MPHQCVKCSKLYPDGSQEILRGCSCGGRFFFFIKQEFLEKAKQISENLSEDEKIQIEHDVRDIVGDRFDEDEPVFLDLESIRILKPGKYELDLVDMFRKKPLVYRLEEGKYIIDLVSTFEAKEKSVEKNEE
ncbi:hypothetical protein HYT51_01540 [Candidatus Woesearchaeota archaeon]|nr:hypothetical protein [Candidatus Woesearchaeota archaeon]